MVQGRREVTPYEVATALRSYIQLRPRRGNLGYKLKTPLVFARDILRDCSPGFEAARLHHNGRPLPFRAHEPSVTQEDAILAWLGAYAEQAENLGLDGILRYRDSRGASVFQRPWLNQVAFKQCPDFWYPSFTGGTTRLGDIWVLHGGVQYNMGARPLIGQGLLDLRFMKGRPVEITRVTWVETEELASYRNLEYHRLVAHLYRVIMDHPWLAQKPAALPSPEWSSRSSLGTLVAITLSASCTKAGTLRKATFSVPEGWQTRLMISRRGAPLQDLQVPQEVLAGNVVSLVCTRPTPYNPPSTLEFTLTLDEHTVKGHVHPI